MIELPVIDRSDVIRAIRRMTETELADTWAEIHKTYTTEPQGVTA